MVAIVVTKAAAMPESCKGRYRRVAMVDVPYRKAWEAFEFYGPPHWLTLPSWQVARLATARDLGALPRRLPRAVGPRSEEHTSELQSLRHLVCRLLLEKK